MILRLVIMHHHSKCGHKRLSYSEDIVRTKPGQSKDPDPVSDSVRRSDQLLGVTMQTLIYALQTPFLSHPCQQKTSIHTFIPMLFFHTLIHSCYYLPLKLLKLSKVLSPTLLILYYTPLQHNNRYKTKYITLAHVYTV